MPKTIIICSDDEQSREKLEKLKASGTITDDVIVISSIDEIMQRPEKTAMDLIENIQRDAAAYNEWAVVKPMFPRHTHERPKYTTKKSKFNKRRK